MNFHQQLGHCNIQMTSTTPDLMGIHLTNDWEPFIACALAKCKQKNIPKSNPHKSTIPGDRFYTDISYITGTSLGGKIYCFVCVWMRLPRINLQVS